MIARNLSIGFTVICTIGAVLALDLGISWITEGYGLNPGLSFPAALFLLCAPFFMAPIIFEVFGDEVVLAEDLRTEEEKQYDDESRVVAYIDGHPMTAKQFFRQIPQDL